MALNSFKVKRVKNRRREIHGIKLNSSKIKGIFESGGKGSGFEDWFLSSVGLRSDGFNLLFNVGLQQAVVVVNSQNRVDDIKQDEKCNIVEGESQRLKKQFLELKKEKALLKRDNRKMEQQLKEREKKVQSLQEKYDICWQSLEDINRKEMEGQKDRYIHEKELETLRDKIRMLERVLQEKEDDLQTALTARNSLCQANTIEFGTVEVIAPVAPEQVSEVLKSPREEDACEISLICPNLSPIKRYNENTVNRKLKRKRDQSASRNLFQLSNFYDLEANDGDDHVECSKDDSTACPCDANLSSFINESTDVPNTPQNYNNFPNQSPEQQIGNLNLNELEVRYAETGKKQAQTKTKTKKETFCTVEFQFRVN